jgi:hypothetical protein
LDDASVDVSAGIGVFVGETTTIGTTGGWDEAHELAKIPNMLVKEKMNESFFIGLYSSKYKTLI